MVSFKHILICLLLSCLNLETKEPVTITWKASHKLQWADFKAKPLLGTSAAALTASGITFGYSLKTLGDEVKSFTTTIYAHFYPEKSWVVPEHANAHILRHEQLHFDITELHVRKLRLEVSKLKPKQGVDQKLSHLHDSIRVELRKMQKAYDAESEHSINKDLQKKWEAFVEKELKSLARFASR